MVLQRPYNLKEEIEVGNRIHVKHNTKRNFLRPRRDKTCCRNLDTKVVMSGKQIQGFVKLGAFQLGLKREPAFL